MNKFGFFVIGTGLGIWFMGLMIASFPPPPVVKYIYDDEARLVGFCNGKYLIREEEDEFPKSGCMFIEPIHWK